MYLYVFFFFVCFFFFFLYEGPGVHETELLSDCFMGVKTGCRQRLRALGKPTCVLIFQEHI